jgi:hypothetical protein
MIVSRSTGGPAAGILVSARFVSLVVGLACLGLAGPAARAQEVKGRIIGHVTDLSTGQPLAGLTVILQGQQGEDAALTDEAGNYSFASLAVGTYTVRFYSASSAINVDRADLHVSAGATVRADAAMPNAELQHETYVIKRKAAAIDVGSARLGATFNEDYMENIPLERTYGDLMLKAPGAFLESSGSVSVAGASGLENVYVMDGLNVTGMDVGDIMNRKSNAQGGSNLTLEFVKEMQLNTGGYRAEYGGAMGGVVNVVTKSGTNEWRGSAFGMWAPYWLSGDPHTVTKLNGVLSGSDNPDFDTNVGVEVGGPLIKDKLFVWLGFAPRFEANHFYRDVYGRVDQNGDGVADVDQNGKTIQNFLLRTRTPELRQSYQYGAKLDFNIAPEHHLSIGVFGTPTFSRHIADLSGNEAVANPSSVLEQLHKNNTDITANWTSQLLENRIRIDATVGLHREDFSDKSPYDTLNATNSMEWHGNPPLSMFESVGGCEVQASGFDPCPVEGYKNGGFGLVKEYVAERWAGDVKATFDLFKYHEIKVGAHAELDTFDQDRYYTGPLGSRNFLYNDLGANTTYIWNFFTLQRNQYPFQYADDTTLKTLTVPPNYQDHLVADVKSVNSAVFVQDSVRPMQNLTIDLGLRVENQRMYDFRGDGFLDLYNLAPRVGAVWDPTDDGRSKVFAHYGQFFETIPMNLAARYFGGEGILLHAVDNSSPQCLTPPSQWTGKGGEAAACPSEGYFAANGGSSYPVQPHIEGQHHHEIVAGVRRALTDDLVVGIDYTHRWLGAIVEDGTAAGSLSNFVLANPGQVPQDAINDLNQQIAAKQSQVDAAKAAGDTANETLREGELGNLQSVRDNLKGLAALPKPERTYDAVTLSAVKRLSQAWMLQASYTYSRLFGNYNGLYDADNSYAAPNGNNAYDYPDLVYNKKGPLANDRPHSGHVDAYYQIPAGQDGFVVVGASFSAYSGIPRNYVAAILPGQQLVFLLPRGSAGRTPTVTQTDVKLSYHRKLSKTMAGEAFLDLYNVMDQRTALAVDDNYTLDVAGAIVNGNVNDLKYARNASGAPINKNPNFGQPTAYQMPIYGRMGVRLSF